MSTENSKKNIYLDGMMGLAVGDALGCPVQFMSRSQIAGRKQGPVTGMEGFGTYHKPAGTWTDDTSMALASLDSIIEKGGIDHVATMENFEKWLLHGEYTPFGESFDEGITCTGAILKYQSEKNITTCGKTGEHANGNGALMRILPVCLYYINRQRCICTSDDEAIQNIHVSTALTHNHLRAQIASGLYYFMAKAIVHGKKSGMMSGFWPANEPEIRKQSETESLVGMLSEMAPGTVAATAIQLLLQEGLDEGFSYYRQDFRNLTQVSYYSRLYDLQQFVNLPESEIRSSGYVVDSLEAAVWCLMTTDSFKDCLLKAVNLGDDTDTVAAIAGGLAGLYYGYEAIPEEWLEVLQAREYVEEMCRRAAEING